ncbi:serine/threonine-protein kinase SRK2B-like isoform X2 [Cucumis melo]|uniref:Serine/threonine-protein kinase SRK2B-like isoform X2 n=1 Tax=Cucumis melo TaxID=3656 RepID=A0ABM3L5J6_CUCME|nr:serine/threonine-protein kinase SRK2B-like isoform X2 [Cucumis melo]
MEKYEFIKELGAGSFGVANLCRDKKRGELVAIKFIERGPTIDENVEREIVNHRLLPHPNVIYFKEVFLTPTHLGLVMEYASGGELFEKIRNQRRPFTEDEQKCNSVGSNSASQSKINNNFGFYKFHSKPNTNVGSATYTAPEVLRGGEYDGKMADVWSCAVALYVMLVAAYPFDDSEDSENSGKTIKRIMSGDYKIPDHIHLSEGCQHLLSRMLIPDPSMRISIKKITTHSWFSNNLQSKQTEPTLELDNPNFSHQSVKEIRNIVIEARNQLAP